MPLRHAGYIELPPHATAGGFDHAAVHRRTGRVYVAHTANDAVDVIDGATRRYVGSIGGLPAVAGALVSDEHDLVLIVVVGADDPVANRRIAPLPSAGPHGLDLDVASRRLFCACDGKALIEIHADSGDIMSQGEIAGAPDVIFFNAALKRLYVAIGDPGLIEVFDTETMRRQEAVPTEQGAHTLAFDAGSNIVYAFLPHTHRAAVYVDRD